MGADIAGACGQLVVEQEKRMQTIGDIEDGPLCSSTNKQSPAIGNSRKQGIGNEKDTNDSEADNLIRRLAVATGIATSCFVLSAFLFAIQRKRR